MIPETPLPPPRLPQGFPLLLAALLPTRSSHSSALFLLLPQIVWQVINHGHCSYKAKMETQVSRRERVGCFEGAPSMTQPYFDFDGNT